jgi:prolyl-tRNA editing enzyme YbaK/EbsC (Cys-tRNA(Pro) deacylase)
MIIRGAAAPLTCEDQLSEAAVLVYCGSGYADRTVEIEAKTLVELVKPVIATLIAD